jgi:hypothetical protein
VVGPILEQRHMTTRLAWLRARRRWRLHTWQHILFSEEFRFSPRFSDERYRVYRSRGERFTHQCVYESGRFVSRSLQLPVCCEIRTFARTGVLGQCPHPFSYGSEGEQGVHVCLNGMTSHVARRDGSVIRPTCLSKTNH